MARSKRKRRKRARERAAAIDPAEEFQRAIAAHKAGDLAAAEQGYRRVLDRDPEHANALNLLGLIALDAGCVADAIELAERATRAAPDVGMFHANLGTALMEQQRTGDAEVALRKAETLGYDHVQVSFNLGLLLMMDSARTDEAVAAFRRAVALDPDNREAEFLLAALAGEQRTTAPLSYVATLFDSYAHSFEDHVVENLAYRIPEKLRQLVARHAPDARDWRVADLGCGTGLCGAAFRDLAGHLAGCDVSPRMVQRAAARALYDDLAVADLSEFLADRSSASAGGAGRFDLIVAADVFIYVGALDDAARAMSAALRPGGHVAFSTETTTERDVALRRSGRFAHAPSYLRGLADRHGFDELASEATVIRTEDHVPIHGHIHLLRKRAG